MNGTIDWTHEDEDGSSPLGVPATLEFELEYHYTPGEPMVRYYPDGSGYPGSSPEVEFTAVCTGITCEDGEREVTKELAKSLGDWFVDRYSDDESIYEKVCEAVDSWEPDYDDRDD